MDRFMHQKSTNLDPPLNPHFSEEQRYFSSIKYIYSNQTNFVRASKTSLNGIDASVCEKNLAKFEVNVNPGEMKESYVKLAAYRYRTPTFYSFVEGVTFDEIGDMNKVPFSFIATIRGILDCKYNEYLLNKRRTNFPDFVFSWLSCFEVDNLTRTIVSIDSNHQSKQESSHQRVARFYSTLQNPLLSKLWEIVTFREFLNEDLSPEELYFYLWCRHTLLKGAQLDRVSSTFEIITFARFEDAEILMRAVMKKFDSETLETLVRHLREKATMKNKHLLVDSSLVLRTLLEYLRTDRMQRFKLIKNLFFSQKGEEKRGLFSLGFPAFKKMMESAFPNASELEKAEIFRECHCVGEGVVNHESFFVVCNESGFFERWLKPSLEESLSGIVNIAEMTICTFEQDSFAKFFSAAEGKRVVNSIERLIEGLGQEVLLRRFQELQKCIAANESSNRPKNVPKNKRVLLKFELLFQEITSASVLRFSQRQSEIDPIIQSKLMKETQKYFENSTILVAQTIFEIRKQNAQNQAKKLTVFQRWMKKKISKWYSLLSAIIMHKLNHLKQEQANVNSYTTTLIPEDPQEN